MAINQDLNRLILSPKPLDRNNVVGLLKMQRSLANYSSTNDFLQNFFIYLNNYHAVLTPSTLFFRPEHYYELNQPGDLTYSQWQSLFLNSVHFNEIIPLQKYKRNVGGGEQRQRSAITFVQSIPLNTFSHPQATIGVIIDEALMGETLRNVVEQYGGWALITTRSGETIFSEGIDGDEIKKLASVPAGTTGDTNRYVDGRLLISIRSDSSGWVYTAGIPKHVIMDKANGIKEVIGTLTVISAAAGLLVGLLLAYRNSMPIHRMLSMFKELHPGSSCHGQEGR